MAKKKSKWICKRCGKDFPSPQHLGGHVGIFTRFGRGCVPLPGGPATHNAPLPGLGVVKKPRLPGVCKARKAKGWSILRLAKEAGVPANTARRIESLGTGHPKNLKKIAQALGTGGDEKPKNAKSKGKVLPFPIQVTKSDDSEEVIEVPIHIKITISIERT